MRLLDGHYENFGSYQVLDLNFDDLGLALVSGPTGAGKSTIMDAPAWCLFGITSKDGTADEVKSWFADGPTVGRQEVQLADRTIITVHRVRGKTNDLYWEEPDLKADQAVVHRGKDLNETQRLLEARLGVSARLWLVAVYLHQFSDAGNFFIARAKDRRAILEEVADLSVAVRLGERASIRRKEAKERARDAELKVVQLSGRLDQLTKTVAATNKQFSEWESSRAAQELAADKAAKAFEAGRQARMSEIAEELEALDGQIVDRKKFEKDRASLAARTAKLEARSVSVNNGQAALSKLEVELDMLTKEYRRFSKPGEAVCPHCLGPSDNDNKKKHLALLDREMKEVAEEAESAAARQEALSAEVDAESEELSSFRETLRRRELENENNINSFESRQREYKQLESSVNAQADLASRLREQMNPHGGPLAAVSCDLSDAKASLATAKKSQAAAESEVVSFSQLYDLSVSLRGRLLDQAIEQLERATNECLEKYFDARVRVEFIIDDDRVEVALQRDGFACSFKQLSGGERCMLKLAFGLSLMHAASDQAGCHFDTLFLDEPLAGLDAELKVKAFGLFQGLAYDHGSVLVIEHDTEFQSLFETKYLVSSDGGPSELRKAGDG
jgi:DNA repair exonuclease SbcCD ATPase subunit